jgi:uncharacterized protein with HEPN domain
LKDDRVYLLHIRDAVARVLDYTALGSDHFFSDPKTQDAVVCNIEIIGEAVKRLSEGWKAQHSGVPWKTIAGMRDRLIHEYFGVNLQLVWKAVTDDLPQSRRIVDSALGPKQT